jgi:hypothetical protein
LIYILFFLYLKALYTLSSDEYATGDGREKAGAVRKYWPEGSEAHTTLKWDKKGHYNNE